MIGNYFWFFLRGFTAVGSAEALYLLCVYELVRPLTVTTFILKGAELSHFSNVTHVFGFKGFD